jgi:hypothetical protein
MPEIPLRRASTLSQRPRTVARRSSYLAGSRLSAALIKLVA